MTSTQVNNLVNDLIIADTRDNGSPLPPGTRPTLEAMLTQVLVDPDRLNDYIRQLQMQMGGRFRHRELLDEATTEAVLKGGLAVLDDAALARLALNPVALAALADEIEERQPAGWTEALREDGRVLLRAHGRTVPPLAELLGRAKRQDPRKLVAPLGGTIPNASPVPRDSPRRGDAVLTTADEVREYARVNIVEPARARGDSTFTIRAGDVHKALRLKSRLPLVCNALAASAFEELCGVERIGTAGPHTGANTTFTYRFLQA